MIANLILTSLLLTSSLGQEAPGVVPVQKVTCDYSKNSMLDSFKRNGWELPEVTTSDVVSSYLFKRKVKEGVLMVVFVFTPRQDDALTLLERGYEEVYGVDCYEEGVHTRVFHAKTFVPNPT